MKIYMAIPVGVVRDSFMTKENVEMLEKLHMQPHLGGPTMDQRSAAARFVFEDIKKGEPLQNEITASRSKTMTR